ncbi:hypothetical protein JCM10207_005002 [Rhodosporidiobolus poonsookiae]
MAASPPPNPARRNSELELDYGDGPDDELMLGQGQGGSADSSFNEQPPHSPPGVLKTEPGYGAHGQGNGSGMHGAGNGLSAQQVERKQSEDIKPNLSSALPVNPLTGLRPPVSASLGPTASTSGSTTGLMTALYIGELHWWTSDADIVELARLAGVDIELRDVSFSEHKVNGKSKGVCFVDCHSADKASQMKRYIDTTDYQMKRMSAQLALGGAISPFKTLPKEPSRPQNQPYSSSQPQRAGGGAVPPRPTTTAYNNPHPQQGWNHTGGKPGGSGGMGMRTGGGGGGMPQSDGMGGRKYGQQGGGQGMGMGMGQQQGMGMGMGQGQQQQGLVNPAFNPGAGGNAGQNQGGGGAFNPALMGMYGMPGFDMSAMGMGMGMYGMGGMGGFGGFGMPGMDFGMSGFGGGGAGTMGAMNGAMGGAPQEGVARKRSRLDG